MIHELARFCERSGDEHGAVAPLEMRPIRHRLRFEHDMRRDAPTARIGLELEPVAPRHSLLNRHLGVLGTRHPAASDHRAQPA